MDRDGYDQLLDFAAENHLSPREALRVLSSAQAHLFPAAPLYLAGVASDPPIPRRPGQ